MMNTDKAIHTELSPFEIDDTSESVQDFFLEHEFSHFPVLENQVYLGCVPAAEADLFGIGKKIGEYRYVFEGFFVRITDNWLEVLERFAKNEANIMPVLDEKNHYLGYYKLVDIVGVISQTAFLREPGGVVVIEKEQQNYTASEIAQIVEGNGYKLLGMFVSEIETNVQIYLKINADNLNDILQSFRRYGYEIISEHTEDTYQQALKEHLDYFEKYLNI